jgi:hypothetical protein
MAMMWPTALGMWIKRHGVQVGNEVDDAILFLSRSQFGVEKILLTGKTIFELIAYVKDEIRRFVDVHDQRQIVRGGKTNGLRRRAIMMLMARVERRRE